MFISPLSKRTVLTQEDLQRKAPSIFATKPASTRSEKYSFIPTNRLLDTLQSQGWIPMAAGQQRVNADNTDRQGYQKHIIRLQHAKMQQQLQKVGDTAPELVVTNSHDGGSSFQLMAGLFRLVCSNGAIVADATINTIRIRHMGYTDSAVIEASQIMIENIPKVFQQIEAFRTMELSEQERIALAVSAAMEKWKVDVSQLPFAPSVLLTPRRTADATPTLWNTFNVLQENLTKGGIRYRKVTREKETGRVLASSRNTTRAITGINEDMRVNKALWTLTENMRRIKAGEPMLEK